MICVSVTEPRRAVTVTMGGHIRVRHTQLVVKIVHDRDQVTSAHGTVRIASVQGGLARVDGGHGLSPGDVWDGRRVGPGHGRGGVGGVVLVITDIAALELGGLQ